MLNFVRAWILLSTLLVSAGWVLSALHELNPTGYGIFFLFIAVAFIFFRRKATMRSSKNNRRIFQKFARRAKHPAPFLFFTLSLLALLGGAMYPPANPDSTSYRIPRVMHWLAAGQWHWIATMDPRMNIIGSGFEWVIAPLILLTHTDRFLFLPNLFSFLLLPGLIFSLFTRLGVSPRVAWWWMWLLPSGWCFTMQAGSTINDSFAAVYALASIDLALRSRESKCVEDLWLAMLAAALATGVKQTGIPLALPGLIAIVGNVRLLAKRWPASLCVASLCGLTSALPTFVLNLKETGNMAGATGGAWSHLVLHSPVWGVIGNIFSLTIQNLKPPFFPFSNSWNVAMRHFLQTPFGSHFREFESFGRLSFGISEQSAALGAGICLLVIISLLGARHYQRSRWPVPVAQPVGALTKVLRWVPWILLVPFMAKIGTFENGRQLAPYYILLSPSLLSLPGQFILVQRRWWKGLAIAVMLLAVFLLVTSRDRPLFPSQAIMGRLAAAHPGSKWVSIMSRTYAGSPGYWNQRSFLRHNLPQDARVLGYAATSAGELESYLWLPYGARRVREVLPDDTPAQLRDVQYVVLENARLEMTHETLSHWLERYNGQVIKEWQFTDDPYSPAHHFYLVLLKSS